MPPHGVSVVILNFFSILHLEDSVADHELVGHILGRSGWHFKLFHVDTLESFETALRDGGVDLVLADYHLAGFSGLDAWEWMRAQQIDLPFVLVSGAIGEAVVADAMVRGVSDYVDKNRLNRLPMVVQRALEHHRIKREREQTALELVASKQRLAELTEHLQESIDRERADIAREIHDDIGGSLAAIRLDLAWLGRRAADDDSRSHVQAAQDMVAHALGASQRIMRNLRPAVLDQGLIAAIEWLVQTFADRTGIRTQLRHAGDMPSLPRDVEMVAYRTAQEALTNVGKHAGATEVRLELSDLEGVLTLEVSDNGRGASPEALAKSHAFGLLGLRERAQTVGGWLDVVNPGPGQGMSLILSVPLDRASHEALAKGEEA
jgi:two-component system, NarL family, sensor histidine kinase UhpB